MRNQIMVGRRVYLRPLEVEDSATLARWYAEEEETFWDNERMPWSPLALEAMLKHVYEKEPPERVNLAVCLRETDELIGVVGIDGVNCVTGPGETDSYFGRAADRGRGLGTEAKPPLVEYAFAHPCLHGLQSF